MMKKRINQPSLDRLATYQIKVPGKFDISKADWAAGLQVNIESVEARDPITTLTGEVDQAALHGLLRRLYSLGLPLISVIWIKGDFSMNENAV